MYYDWVYITCIKIEYVSHLFQIVFSSNVCRLGYITGSKIWYIPQSLNMRTEQIFSKQVIDNMNYDSL